MQTVPRPNNLVSEGFGQEIIEANRKASPNAAFGVYLAIFVMYYLACRPLSLAAKKLEKHWR